MVVAIAEEIIFRGADRLGLISCLATRFTSAAVTTPAVHEGAYPIVRHSATRSLTFPESVGRYCGQRIRRRKLFVTGAGQPVLPRSTPGSARGCIRDGTAAACLRLKICGRPRQCCCARFHISRTNENLPLVPTPACGSPLPESHRSRCEGGVRNGCA